MTCREFRAWYHQLLKSEPPADFPAEAYRRHLVGCEACQLLLTMDDVSDVVGEYAGDLPPRVSRERSHRIVRRVRRRARVNSILRAAGVVGVAIASFTIGWYHLKDMRSSRSIHQQIASGSPRPAPGNLPPAEAAGPSPKLETPEAGKLTAEEREQITARLEKVVPEHLMDGFDLGSILLAGNRSGTTVMIVRVSSRADVYEGVRRLASELPESVILGTSLTISVGDPDPEAKTGLRAILIITFPLAKLREIREKKLTTLGFLQEFPVTLDTGHKLNRRR